MRSTQSPYPARATPSIRSPVASCSTPLHQDTFFVELLKEQTARAKSPKRRAHARPFHGRPREHRRRVRRCAEFGGVPYRRGLGGWTKVSLSYVPPRPHERRGHHRRRHPTLPAPRTTADPIPRLPHPTTPQGGREARADRRARGWLREGLRGWAGDRLLFGLPRGVVAMRRRRSGVLQRARASGHRRVRGYAPIVPHRRPAE